MDKQGDFYTPPLFKGILKSELYFVYVHTWTVKEELRLRDIWTSRRTDRVFPIYLLTLCLWMV